VVNAAGVAGGTISTLAGGEELHIWPRKGQYWVLDRAFGSRLRKMVLPVPMPHTRGVQVVPTTNGSALLGPDAQDIADPADKGTDPDSLQALLRLTEQLVPAVSRNYAIKTYAANRAAAQETVRVRPDALRRNLLHVGNRSTGVSSSPGTAERVLDLLREAGLECPDRPDPVRALPKIRRLLHDPDPESLPETDPRYRQVVCVCEQVTAAEIAAVFDRHVPPRSIEGIRKRTQATGGRCQGSVCMVGVAFLCSLHTGLPPAAIRQGPAGATLGVGSEP
jgi:glycerol-3-phosphate dehydrogenase